MLASPCLSLAPGPAGPLACSCVQFDSVRGNGDGCGSGPDEA